VEPRSTTLASLPLHFVLGVGIMQVRIKQEAKTTAERASMSAAAASLSLAHQPHPATEVQPELRVTVLPTGQSCHDSIPLPWWYVYASSTKCFFSQEGHQRNPTLP